MEYLTSQLKNAHIYLRIQYLRCRIWTLLHIPIEYHAITTMVFFTWLISSVYYITMLALNDLLGSSECQVFYVKDLLKHFTPSIGLVVGWVLMYLVATIVMLCRRIKLNENTRFGRFVKWLNAPPISERSIKLIRYANYAVLVLLVVVMLFASYVLVTKNICK